MNRTLHIFRKETREMFRDKRVRSSAFITPPLILIMMISLIGMIEGAVKKPATIKLHVVGDAKSMPADLMPKDGPVKIEVVPSFEKGEELLRQGKAKVVLQFPDNMAQAMAGGGQAHIKALYDKTEMQSQLALRAFEAAIEMSNKKSLQGVLKSANLPETSAAPLVVDAKEIAIKEALGNSPILSMIPYLIVIWAFYGGMSIVSDLVAGEKEKNTLETLLISPAKRTEVAFGKFLALALVCLLSSLTTLVAIIVVGTLHLPATKSLFPNGVAISPVSMIAILGVLLPLVAFFASLMLAISAFAKNTREAQTHLALVSFVVIMPAVFGQFISFTEFGKSIWVNMVPVMNSSNNIRDALLGKISGAGIGITVAMNLVLAAIGLYAAVKLFKREEVLTRV